MCLPPLVGGASQQAGVRSCMTSCLLFPAYMLRMQVENRYFFARSWPNRQVATNTRLALPLTGQQLHTEARRDVVRFKGSRHLFDIRLLLSHLQASSCTRM